MKKSFIKWIPSKTDVVITAAALSITTIICVVLKGLSDTETYVPLLYVLAVLLVARFTNSYTCGLIAAVVAVLGVNYAFTYPYMAFNFSITGYPITFTVMLAVATSTSTLTVHIKHQEMINLENSREKMRANLLRAISHDLRTPLTSIIGSVSTVLENDTLPPEQSRSLLEDVKSDAEWLIRMVENLLSVTRIENGKQNPKLKKTPEAVEEIVSEVVTKFRKRFPNIKVNISIPDHVLFVPMDAVLIEQVLYNLFENAVIHGERTENIRLSVTEQLNNAVFVVDDDGCGISDEILPRLFTDYFDRASISHYREKRNMGIGLSVCMTIIKAHDGNMTAKNNDKGGASFKFVLPLE